MTKPMMELSNKDQKEALEKFKELTTDTTGRFWAYFFFFKDFPNGSSFFLKVVSLIFGPHIYI